MANGDTPKRSGDQASDKTSAVDDSRKHSSQQATAVGDREALTAVKPATTAKAGESLQLTGSQLLAPEAINKAAKTVNEAAFRRNLWGIGHAEPDVTSIVQILEPMKAADRQRVEKQYEATFHRSLRADLQDKLGPKSENWARVEGILNRKDNTSDEAGQIRTAMARLANAVDRQQTNSVQDRVYAMTGNPLGLALNAFSSGRDGDLRTRAEQDIRRSIGSMTSTQLEDVKKRYQENYGSDLQTDLKNNPNISKETKEALDILFKGVEKRTGNDPDSIKQTKDLAAIALRTGDMDLFTDAMQTGSEAARRSFLDDGGQAQIDRVWSGDNRARASSLAQRGVPDLASAIEGNHHWYHSNKNEITRLVSSPTEIDRQDFLIGRKLAESKTNPANPDEQRALNFYNRVHSAFEDAGNTGEVVAWESQLSGDGKVIAEVAKTYGSGFIGIGAGVDRDQMFKNIENIKREDWQKLHDSPAEMLRVEAALKALATPEDRTAIMQMLREKISVDNFAESKQVGRRSIQDVFKSDQPADALERLSTLSDKERREFLAQPKQLSDLVKTLPSGMARNEGERLLTQYRRGQQPNSADAAIISALRGDNPRATISAIEQAFTSDPTLKDRLKNPKTDEEKQFKREFQVAAELAIGEGIIGQKTVETLFGTGHLPLENKLRLSVGTTATKYDDILNASDEEKRLLLADPASDRRAMFLQNMTFRNDDEKGMLQLVLRQGGMDNADKVRAFVLGDHENVEDLKTMLGKMTAEQKQDLANKYFTKYKQLISEDVVSNVPKSDQFRLRQMLSPTDISVRQVVLDARTDAYDHTSAFDPLLNKVWDRSQEGAVDANNQLDQFVKQHAADLEKLSPEDRKKFTDAVDNYQQAVKNYVESKGQFADAVVNATITVAAIGGSVFTGGGSLALLTALGAGAGGAAFRVGAISAIEGGDFEGSVKNISKEAFKGFTASMLGFLSAEAMGLKGVTTVGSELAQSAVPAAIVRAGENGLGRAAFRTSEDIAKIELEKGIAGLGRQALLAGRTETNQAIEQLASKVLVEGATAEQKATLTVAIRESLQKEITAGIKNKLINEAEMFAINSASATLGTTATEVAATGLGFEKPEDLYARIQSGALSSVAGTAVFTVAFKAIGAGGKTLQAVLGRDEKGLYAGKGTVVENERGERIVVGDEKYRFQKGDRVVEEVKPGDALAERPPKRTESIDADGRPREFKFRERVREEFKPMSDKELAESKRLVVSDLKDVKVSDGNGNFESAFTRLNKSVLSEPDKDFVITMMAEVREHYAALKVDGKQIGDQAVNWIHTQGEMTRVLESAGRNNLNSEQTKDALIAAMFSDASKFTNTSTTKMNFWTHHLDGALAADEILTRNGYPRERIDMITQAIREHQIGPPEFMGMIYRMQMANTLKANIEKSVEGSPERAHLEHLQKVLEENTVKTSFGPGFRPIADVNHMPVVKNGNGEWELALTKDQRELLSFTGNEHWYVPRNPELDPDFPKMSASEKERAISVFKISQALLDGDTIDNYATLNGVSKYVQIRGPETMFKDPTVWDSSRSVDTSYNDAFNILSPEAKSLAKLHFEEKNRVLNDEQTGIRAQMDQWLREMNRDPSSEQIPFYNAPLKYPDPEGKLTEAEQRDFDFAKKIRSHMVDLLRQAARTNGDVPGEFKSVTDRTIDQQK